jgi:protein phosphatase 1 regulatory subunit 7
VTREYVDIPYSRPVAPTEFDVKEEVIDLTNFQIKSISEIKNVLHCTQLHTLVLRQNLVNDFQGIEALAPSLTKLDLYENKVNRSNVAPVAALTNLTWLDLSFNSLREVPNALAPLTQLTHIYLLSNKMTELKNLTTWPALKMLELGDNRIRTLQGLEGQAQLEELYLGRNKIVGLTGLAHLSQLRILSLQSNRIISMVGLRGLVSLEELYLSHNGIHEICDIEPLTKLRVLDVGNNRLTTISGVATLVELEEFWINNNTIGSAEDDAFQVLEILQGLSKLETIYLEHNPLQLNPGYRELICKVLPSITQVDAIPI